MAASISVRHGLKSVEIPERAQRFFGFFPEATAVAQRVRLEAASRDALHFAFVASDDPPNAFYLRVQGPTLLIEIDNTSDGDHVHAVWHDLVNDFGDDVLARHLRDEHGLRLADRVVRETGGGMR